MRRGPSAQSQEGPDAAGATGPEVTERPSCGGPFVLCGGTADYCGVMPRLLLLPVLLCVAGCGSASHADGTITPKNATKLVLAPLSVAPEPAVRGRGWTNYAPAVRSPNGRWSVVAQRGTVEFRDARTGSALDVLQMHRAQPTSITWSSDSRLFAVGTDDGVTTVWDELHHHTYELLGAKAPVGPLSFARDDSMLAVAEGRRIAVWDARRQRLLVEVSAARPPAWLRFERRRIVIGGEPLQQLRLPH